MNKFLLTMALLIQTMSAFAEPHAATPNPGRGTTDSTSPYKLKSDDADSIMLNLQQQKIVKKGEAVVLTGEMSCSDLIGPDGKLMLLSGKCLLKVDGKTINPHFPHNLIEMLPYQILIRFKPVAPFEKEMERKVVFDFTLKSDANLENTEISLIRKKNRDIILGCKSLTDGQNIAFNATVSENLDSIKVINFATENGGSSIPQELQAEGKVSSFEASSGQLKIEANWGGSTLSLVKRSDQDLYDGTIKLSDTQKRLTCQVSKNY